MATLEQNRLRLLAVERTLTALEDEAVRGRYKWSDPSRCNCGIFVRYGLLNDDMERFNTELFGGLVKQFVSGNVNHDMGHWCTTIEMIEQGRCTATGVLWQRIVGELSKAGMTSVEIENLENLADADVLNLVPAEEKMHLYRADINALISYLKAWRTLLQRDIAIQSVTVKTIQAQTQGVAV
jgi:hypothetical protein